MANNPVWEARYQAAAHAVQSALAAVLGALGPKAAGADPKHLRTGLNLVMADHGSLADLLIRKGVITEEEYLEAIAAGTEREAERTAARARQDLNLPDAVTFQ